MNSRETYDGGADGADDGASRQRSGLLHIHLRHHWVLLLFAVLTGGGYGTAEEGVPETDGDCADDDEADVQKDVQAVD